MGRRPPRPAVHVAAAARRAAGQRLARSRAQPVEGHGHQARPHVPLLGRLELVRGPAAELLDQPGDVQGGDVGAQPAVALSPGDDLLQAGHAAAGRALHLRGGLDLPGQRGERPAAQLDAGPDVAAQAIPWVGGGQGVVGRSQRLVHRQHAQPLQQLGLAAVPAVQRAHADSGALGDRRDRRARALGGEDVTGGFEYHQVITPRLGLAAVPGLRAQGPERHPSSLSLFGADHSDKILVG